MLKYTEDDTAGLVVNLDANDDDEGDDGDRYEPSSAKQETSRRAKLFTLVQRRRPADDDNGDADEPTNATVADVVVVSNLLCMYVCMKCMDQKERSKKSWQKVPKLEHDQLGGRRAKWKKKKKPPKQNKQITNHQHIKSKHPGNICPLVYRSLATTGHPPDETRKTKPKTTTKIHISTTTTLPHTMVLSSYPDKK